MPYTLTYSLGSIVVNDFTLNTQTSLTIPGYDAAAYGQPVDQNQISLLENFASSTSGPANAIPGQLWYDNTARILKVNNSVDLTPNWSTVGPDLPIGGANGQVQFNNNGQFGGNVGFRYNNTNNTLTVGNITANSITANIAANTITATSVNTTFITGSIANITTINTLTLTATNADLGEKYVSDSQYEPGTVVEFGGDYEVTIAEDGTRAVAGVVSTNAAYIMNSACVGDHVVIIALQGRVPTKVRGKIRKGDMMISGGDGYARPSNDPQIGSIIGKALENFNGIGVIEVAVGRL
jgi:hypothetical protein